MTTDSTDKTPEVSTTLTWLSRAYDLSLEGFPGLEGGRIAAQKARGSSPRARAREVIKWASLKAGCLGFATNLGGLFTLPISLPANLVGTALIQIAMVQSIALIAGYDLKDERVKTMVLLAALGMGVAEIVKGLGVPVAKALADQLVRDVITQGLAKLLTRKVVAQTASRSLARWMTKIIPLVGGVLGGLIDAAATKLIGETAISLFLPDETEVAA